MAVAQTFFFYARSTAGVTLDGVIVSRTGAYVIDRYGFALAPRTDGTAAPVGDQQVLDRAGNNVIDRDGAFVFSRIVTTAVDTIVDRAGQSVADRGGLFLVVRVPAAGGSVLDLLDTSGNLLLDTTGSVLQGVG